jgi:hypothetical protein
MLRPVNQFRGVSGSFGDGELNPHPNCRSLELSLLLAVSTEGFTPAMLSPDYLSSRGQSLFVVFKIRGMRETFSGGMLFTF